MITYAYGAKAPVTQTDLVWQELERAHRYRNHLVDIERTRRGAKAGSPSARRALSRRRAVRGRLAVGG